MTNKNITDLDKAINVAKKAHGGQKDKAGNPYYYHLQRVANKIERDSGKTVAWLHDILEDTDVTLVDLANLGFSVTLLSSVIILTRQENETYFDYIKQIIRSNEYNAIQVKLADLDDHLRFADQIPESLVKRYEKARDMFNDHGFFLDNVENIS